jgi:hypothetical protein
VTSISEVVYQLSAKAVGALNNPDSALPPDLRALLSMVDGVSPVAQYQPFLKALEPIGPKLASLEQRGYLQRIGLVSDRAVADFQHSVISGAPISTWQKIDSESPESGFVPLP